MANIHKFGEITYGVKFQPDTSALRDLKRELDEISNKAKDLSAIGNTYSDSYKMASEAAKDLQKALDVSWNKNLGQLNLSKLQKEIEKNYGTLSNFRENLSMIGLEGTKAFNQLSQAIFETQVPIKKSNELLDKMAITFKNTVRYGISSSIFNNFTNSISKAYGYVKNLDQSLNDIRIVSNKSADEMGRLAQQANKAAQALGNTTLDYTKASLIYYQQGLGEQEVADRTNVTLKMANVLGASAQEVSDYMTAIWNNFDNGSESLEHYADVITALGAATASSSEEIATGLEKFAAIGDTVGLSYEYATSALATVVAKTRQSADTVGTAFKTLFARIQDLELGETLDDGTTLGKYSSALEKVGVNIKDNNGELKQMDQILSEMGEKWQTLSKAQQVALAQTVAGTRQYSQLIALMDNWDEFQTNLGVARNSEGTLQRQEEIYLDSVEAHLNKLQASWEKFYDAIFDEDSIKLLADGLNSVINLGTTFVNGLGGGLNNLIYTTSMLGNIFSSQLANGILNAKDNAEALKTSLENINIQEKWLHELNSDTNLLKLSSGMSLKDIEEEDKIQNRLLNVRKYISEEEQNQLVEISAKNQQIEKELSLLNEVISLYKQSNEILDKYSSASDFKEILEEQASFNTRTSNLKIDAINMVNAGFEDKDIESLNQDIESFISRKDLKALFAETYEQIEQESVHLTDVFKELSKNEEKWTAEQKDFAKNINERINRLNELSSAIARVSGYLKKGGPAGFKKDFFLEIDDEELELAGDALKELKSKQEEAIDGYEQLIELVNKYNLNSIAKTEEVIKKKKKENTTLKEAKEAFIESQERQKTIEGTLQLTFSAASSISALFGGIKTLLNDSMSPLEKFGSLLTVASVQGLNLYRTWGKIKDTLPILATQLKVIESTEAATLMIQKGQSAQLTAKVAKQLILNGLKKVQLAIETAIQFISGHWYTLLLAGAAAIYGIVKAYDTWFSKETRLNKEIEKSNKALAKTQEAYKEISDTISNYESAQKAIEGLTEGTVEFYNAILKANEESQKLIETLKLVAGTDYTIDTNGKITIDENALKRQQLREQQKVYVAQSNTYRAKADYVEQSNEGGLNGVYNDLVNAINKYNKNHDSDIRINKTLAKDILANESSNEKMYKIVSSIQENTEDIKNQKEVLDWTGPIASVKGNYETLTAELRNYRRLQADALIRASQTQDMVKQYSNLTVKMQQQIQDYVYNKTNLADETYRKNKLANNYGSQNTLVQYNPQDIKDNNYKLPYTGIQTTVTAQNDKRQSEKEALQWFVEEYLKLNKVEGKNTYTYNGENKTSTAIMQEEGYTTEQLISLKAADDAYKQLQTIIQKVTNLDIISGKGLDTVTYLSNARLALENAETSEDFGFVGPPKKGQEGTKTKIGVDFDFNILTDEEFNLLKEEVKKEVEAATSDTEVTLDENLQAVSNYLESLDHHYDSVKRQEQDLTNYNNELSVQSEALGASKKALDLYARATINAEKALNKLSQETARAATEEYSFNKSYNEAVSVFKDNSEAYKMYVDAIKKGEKVSYDVADATAEIADAVQAFGLTLTSEDLVTYYSKITKLLSGTEKEAEQAYEELSKISEGNSWDEWTSKVIENSDLSKDAITSLKQTIIDLNENSYLDENNLDNLRNYINAAKMSYEELEQFLANNHLVIETEAGKAPALVENNVPTTEITQTHTLSFDDGINPYTGKKQTKPITWTEKTSSTTTPYYTLGEGAEVKKTGSNLKNFKKSIANSKSSGGNNEPDKMDPLKNEIDRYHKVNTQITKVDNSLKKLQSQQEKFVGGELLDNLNKQWNLLNIQIQNYNEKLRIANEEQAELAAKLSAKGVNFNADGTVNNYAEAIRAQEAYVNGLIDNYNRMSKKAQESYKETVEKAKEDFEQFKTDIDRYDELISSFIPDINQSIQDAIDSQIENNIQKFNIEITVALDMSQATRDWNAWVKRAIEGFSAEDIFGNAQARLKDFYSYFNESGTGEIQETTKHLENILTELNKQNNGQDNIFGNNTKKGLEELNTYYTKLMQSITDIIELQDELQQDVLDEMDEVQEKFDKQIDSYSYLREIINHDIKVIQMTLGEDAYSEMSKFYDIQQKNYEKQLDFQRQQRDFWYAEMQAAEEGSKEWDSAREKWQNAVNQFNSLLEEGLENAKTKFENAINNIFKKLNNTITGGMGLDYVNTQWDLINKNADRYLDTINATYAIRELEKKYTDSINNSDNIAVQQRLQKVMEEQLTGLKERDRLTQYDVDRANKLYEIELARIALEESQRNKSQMRLRRDSQGNYSYQYVADDDAISEAEDKLNGLYNDLYNFDKERYNDTLNSIYETWSEYQEAMAAAALINDPELRAEKERLIQEQYNELMMQVEEDFQVAKFSLQESFFNDWVNLNDMTLEQFKNLTDNEKDIIMTEFVPTWKNGISEMAEVFAGPEGFAKVTQDAWYAIKEAEQGYSNDIKELENVSKQTFEAIANGQDEAIDKAKDLIKENTELINAYGEELDRVQEVYEKVKQLRQEYEAAEKAAIAATKAAYEFEHKSQEKQISEVQNGTSTTSSAGVSNTSGSGSSGEAANAGGSGSGGNGSPEVGETVNYNGGRYYSTSYGGGTWGSRSGGQVKITIVKSGRPYPIHIATTSGGALGWVREDQISGYDTGGYTGSWDNSGKLAMLHQKELVLNASDTKNMLNAVSVMRSMAYSLGSNLLARLAGVSANGINGGVSSGTVLEQNVHIDATFPNVRNAAEIEEALNNLTNAASQRIYEK